MSIKIGYSNYTYGDLSHGDTILNLNSFGSSDVIVLNDKDGASSEVLINYANTYSTGLVGDSFVFRDLVTGIDRVSVGETIAMDGNLVVVGDFDLNGALQSVGSTTTLNSNVIVNMFEDNSFSVSNNSKAVLSVSSNSDVQVLSCNVRFSTFDDERPLMSIDHSNVNIQGTLFVNEISGFGNNKLVINDAVYSAAIIENITASTYIHVENSPTDTFDDVPFLISKKYANADLIAIDSFANDGSITKNMYMNRDGMLGIGTSTPSASLTITKINDTVLLYDGDKDGDLFSVSRRGNIGIGTQLPEGQLQIVRNDDLRQDDIRTLPMLNLKMNYNPENNIKNLFDVKNSSLTSSGATELKIYNKNTQASQQGVGVINISIANDFHILNDDIFVNFLSGNIDNFTKIDSADTFGILEIDTVQSIESLNVSINNRIIFPSKESIHIEQDQIIVGTLLIVPNDDVFEVNIEYELFLMSVTTKDRGGYINDTTNANFSADRFSDAVVKFDGIIFSDGTYLIKCRIKMYIEKNSLSNTSINYPISYRFITQLPVAPPDFLTVQFNDTFLSSLSPEGTLSLGSRVPDAKKDDYLLYSFGSNYMTSVETERIRAIGNTISFDGSSIADVGSFVCDSLVASSFSVSQLNGIQSITGGSITMDSANYEKSFSSDMSFNTLSNDYVSFSNENVHIGTRLSVGMTEGSKETANLSSLKITVDAGIVPSMVDAYNTRNGILVTNEDAGVNPCLSVKSFDDTTVPHISIGNGASGYHICLKKEIATHFQISTDDYAGRQAYFTANGDSPHILQHIKDHNILSFGEQDIVCIDTLNRYSKGTSFQPSNHSSKVSIGLPYEVFLSQYTLKDAHLYFNEKINVANNEYLLNVFGNMRVANINNETMLTCKSVKDPNDSAKNIQSVGINGDLQVEDDIIVNIDGQRRSLKLIISGLITALGQGATDVLANAIVPST